MKRLEQQFRCRHCDLRVTGIRAEIEQQLGKHLMAQHGITDGWQMGRSIERIW